MGLFFPLAVAFVAPLLASLVPKFIYRQGLSAKANHIMLGISAGLLFAIATLDLVPEAFSMTAQASFSAPSTHGTATTSPPLLAFSPCVFPSPSFVAFILMFAVLLGRVANESGHDHGSEHGGEGDHGHDHGDEEHPSARSPSFSIPRKSGGGGGGGCGMAANALWWLMRVQAESR